MKKKTIYNFSRSGLNASKVKCLCEKTSIFSVFIFVLYYDLTTTWKDCFKLFNQVV